MKEIAISSTDIIRVYNCISALPMNKRHHSLLISLSTLLEQWISNSIMSDDETVDYISISYDTMD